MATTIQSAALVPISLGIHQQAGLRSVSAAGIAADPRSPRADLPFVGLVTIAVCA